MELDMLLPKGKTCGDCKYMPTCRWLVGREGNEKECDWAPSRFAEKVAAVAPVENQEDD